MASLARAAQPSAERSLEAFITRANETLADVKPVDVSGFDAEKREQALRDELGVLQARLASSEARAKPRLAGFAAAFGLGCAVTFAVTFVLNDHAPAPMVTVPVVHRETVVHHPPPPREVPSTTIAAPAIAPPLVVPSPAIASPAIASPAIASPAIPSPVPASPTPTHATLTKRRPTAKAPLVNPQPVADKPVGEDGLYNPF